MKVDVKFVFATNKDIKTETEEGRFRHDLYYRISVNHSYPPPFKGKERGYPFAYCTL